ncbi:hypothetical protein MIR68_000924 [Amoeboaphelidium protococcarum]|nr:hypothetical protein MIR68_000924 [Amoeboaphelidium protococcarum]
MTRQQDAAITIDESSKEDTELISQYLNHLTVERTESGMINLPKLWQKLPSAKTLWSHDSKSRKLFDRWKNSEQGVLAKKLNKIENTSDVTIELILPFLRKLGMDEPVISYGVAEFKKLKQETQSITSSSRVCNKDVVEGLNPNSQQNSSLASESSSSSVDTSSAPKSRLQASLTDQGVIKSSCESGIQQIELPSCHGDESLILPSHSTDTEYKLSIADNANVRNYLPDASQLQDAKWLIEQTLSKLPQVLPESDFQKLLKKPPHIGSQRILLDKDILWQFGTYSEEVSPTLHGIVACVMKALHLPVYSQEVGLLCFVFSLLYPPAVVSDLVTRLLKATGACDLPQLQADCLVLETAIAQIPGCGHANQFHKGWLGQCYVVNWMASCYYKTPQSIFAKLPVWSAFCCAADPRRAFLAITVLHSLIELPTKTFGDLLRAVSIKPGNLVTIEQLRSPLFLQAMEICDVANLKPASQSLDILNLLQRGNHTCFKVDSLKQPLQLVQSSTLTVKDMSKCHECAEEKIAECMQCNCAFCQAHAQLHANHATTLEDPGSANSSMSAATTP